jgi:hypothetical protein
MSADLQSALSYCVPGETLGIAMSLSQRGLDPVVSVHTVSPKTQMLEEAHLHAFDEHMPRRYDAHLPSHDYKLKLSSVNRW